MNLIFDLVDGNEDDEFEDGDSEGEDLDDEKVMVVAMAIIGISWSDWGEEQESDEE